jgi:hypothetical protein
LLRNDDFLTDGICSLTINPSQAIGGYFIKGDGSIIVGNGMNAYLLPLYRGYHWIQDNWKFLTLGLGLSLMCLSFLVLAYGLYLDRRAQSRNEQQQHQRKSSVRSTPSRPVASSSSGYNSNADQQPLLSHEQASINEEGWKEYPQYGSFVNATYQQQLQSSAPPAVIQPSHLVSPFPHLSGIASDSSPYLSPVSSRPVVKSNNKSSMEQSDNHAGERSKSSTPQGPFLSSYQQHDFLNE